jgi:hypothetical protein
MKSSLKSEIKNCGYQTEWPTNKKGLGFSFPCYDPARFVTKHLTGGPLSGEIGTAGFFLQVYLPNGFFSLRALADASDALAALARRVNEFLFIHSR